MKIITKAMYKLTIAICNMPNIIVTILTLGFYSGFMKKLPTELSFRYMKWLLSIKK